MYVREAGGDGRAWEFIYWMNIHGVLTLFLGAGDTAVKLADKCPALTELWGRQKTNYTEPFLRSDCYAEPSNRRGGS